MKELWKYTFHDSCRYIDIVFDNYFSLDHTFVRYDENRLIASMLCVGYEFQILTKGGEIQTLRGMYLCGLATHPEWRRKGIMSDLMKEAEAAALAMGYDLCFLIPADDHLREYYHRKGYETLSWRKQTSFEKGECGVDQGNDLLHIYSIRDLFQRGKIEFLNQLAEWCREIERKSNIGNRILHSQQDMLAIMEENENSIFLTESSFDPEYPILRKVSSVIFPELSEASDKPLRIVGHFTRNDKGYIKEADTDVTLTEQPKLRPEQVDAILTRFKRTKLQLIEPSTGPIGETYGEEPYAMVKLISTNAKQHINENTKFEICLMLD